MTTKIIEFEETLLAGVKTQMSLLNNKTQGIWQQLMPNKHTIPVKVSTEHYSVEIYPQDYFQSFDPTKEFEKWAAVPIKEAYQPDDPIQILKIPEGKYAVFSYKGKSSEAHKAYRYIFEEWMPKSDYQVDNRPHFAIMGEKYRNDHPDSEEELWVPVKKSN